MKPLVSPVFSVFLPLFGTSENEVWLNERVRHCIKNSLVAFVFTKFAHSFC